MSNPAIVVLTDPSRCGAGDVHHLVQALLEIQQMGEYATPQAFCDHPAAAKDFMTAYTHAYPKLVLESREIPTPDHLEALITAGRIGPLGRQPDVGSFDESWRPIDQNGLNPLPLVVLTLGSPQVLLDALRQSHLMKESISLIDIVPDGAGDGGPVSISEVVAIRGRSADGLDDTGPGAAAPQLDEVARAAATGSTDLALREDQIGLDTVEPVDPPARATLAYNGNGQKDAYPGAPAIPAAPAEPAAEDGQSGTPAGAQDGDGAAPGPVPLASAEPALEAPAPAQPAWPTDGGLLPPSTPPLLDLITDALSPGAAAPGDTPDETPDGGAPDHGAADDGGEEQPDDGGPDDEEPGQPPAGGSHDDGAGAHGRDDDVHYEPVGTLRADADVRYPAPEHADDPATLLELAAVLADDGILDTAPNSETPSEPADGRDSDSADLEAILNHSSHDNVVTFDDLYASVDADTEGAGDGDVHHPLHHDSDL